MEQAHGCSPPFLSALHAIACLAGQRFSARRRALSEAAEVCSPAQGSGASWWSPACFALAQRRSPYSVIPRGPAVGDRPRERGRFRALAGAPRRRSLPASLVALSRCSSRDWGRRRRRLRASAAGVRLGRNALHSGPLVFGVAFPRVTACANPGAQGVTASANSSQGHC